MYKLVHSIYLTDEEIIDTYRKIMYQKKDLFVSYMAVTFTPASWLKHVKKDTWFVLVRDESDNDLGAFWLDGFRNQVAFIHIASFGASVRTAFKVSKYALSWMKDELPKVNTILGFIPVLHQKVIKFQGMLGFTKIGEIPNAITLADGKVVNAFLSYYKLREKQ